MLRAAAVEAEAVPREAVVVPWEPMVLLVAVALGGLPPVRRLPQQELAVPWEALVVPVAAVQRARLLLFAA